MSTTTTTQRSCIWQAGTEEIGQCLRSMDDQTWGNANSRLVLDNQLRRIISRQGNGDDHIIKTSSADILWNSSEIYPPLPLPLSNNKPMGFYGQVQPEKWYKTLPPAEMLPRNEVLGGYIFVCNNETMQDDLRHQLFGLPQKYKDSVRAITPGLPLFLYNYTAHQLHGVYQAVSFGGSNIDPTAWEDKKCRGESRFPAQVRIRIKKKCRPLEEDAFRPILYHYDGPKFRLQLSVSEALALLDLFKEDGM